MTTPTLGSFIIPNLVNTQTQYTIIQPSSDSSGSFTYSVTYGNGITITDNIINIVPESTGSYTITATQSSAGSFTEATKSCSFFIYNAYWKNYRGAQPDSNEYLYDSYIASGGTWNSQTMKAYMGLNDWCSIIYINNTYIALSRNPSPNSDNLYIAGNTTGIVGTTQANFQDPTVVKQVMISSDGIGWTGVVTPQYTEPGTALNGLRDTWNWRAFAFKGNTGGVTGRNRIVAVASDNGNANRGNILMFSNDYGASWIPPPSSTVNHLPSLTMIYSNTIHKFMSLHINSPFLVISSDGVLWKRYTISPTMINYSGGTGNGTGTTSILANWTNLCYAPFTSGATSGATSCYIAVANNNVKTNPNLRTILKFVDNDMVDIDTTTQVSGTATSGVFKNDNYKISYNALGIQTIYDINSVEYGNTIFGYSILIAVGIGCILRSYNGDSWNAIDTTNQTFISSTTWNKVIFSDFHKLFIASGNNGKCIVSSDGLIWTETNTNNNLTWTSLVYGNNKIVAVSSDTTTFTNVMNGLDLNTNIPEPPTLSGFQNIPNLTSKRTLTTYTINPPTSSNTGQTDFIYTITTISGTTATISNNIVNIPASSQGTYILNATQRAYDNFSQSSNITSNQFEIKFPFKSYTAMFSVPTLSFL